jgi:exodeoxyribonuclease V gamma subunit
MLWVVSGNDPERLAGELARKINRLRSPFEFEKVLVTSPLKAAHLQEHLAREIGLFSGIKMVPPGNFLWSVLSECFPDAPSNNPLSKIGMSFSLMEDFSRPLAGGPEEVPLPVGLAYPEDTLSRWELASTLAEIFDRILIYRPDWITRWETELSHGDAWGDLWTFLTRKTPSHRASLLGKFSRLVREAPDSLKGKSFLKTPVHVIGHPLLPPSFLDFLKDLSILTDVVIYQWQPTPLYLLPGLKSSSSQGSAVNPLTRALGAQSIRMRDLCFARSDQTEEVFSAPEEKSLLSQIQMEIINDRTGFQSVASEPDDSLHICLARTPIGEVEALYQELVSSFSRDRSLLASDVLVMVSDLDLFAPFIDAVFQEKNSGGGSIPYRIVGRGREDSFQYIENCSKVARGKCSASEVMALLDHRHSMERFGLDHQEVEIIERWVSRLPVWWGISPEMRESFGSPEPDLNTFSWGIERLLLSFPFTNSSSVGNMIPFDAGDLWEVAPILERFQGFLRLLLDLRSRLPDEASGSFWGETVSWMAGHLFSENFSTQEPDIYSSMISFSRLLAPVNNEDEVRRMSSIRIPFEGFLQMLKNQLGLSRGESSGSGAHGVTFAPIVSARGIPSRVIALMGMSSDLYTMKERMVSYDPLMIAPRAGDHSRREDDQGIFLEALLSCKDSIFISYSGSGQESPGEILPSAPLSYLIDLVQTINPDWEQTVTTRGFLEGFSVRKKIVKKTEYPLIPVPDNRNEVIPAKFPDEIELEELRSFIRDPSRFFWSIWSGGPIRNTVTNLPSGDPFVPGWIESRILGKKIFSYLDDRGGELPSMDLLTPLGLLPHGSAGGTMFETLSGSISGLWREQNLFLRQYQTSGFSLQDVPIFLIPEKLGQSFSLRGKVNGIVFGGNSDIYHAVFLPYHHSKKDLFSFLVDHLMLSICYEDKNVISTIHSLSSREGESYSFKGDGKRVLHDIFSLFCYGSLVPVPVFLKSSWKYAELWLKFRKKQPGENSPHCFWDDINGADRRKALEKAEEVWISGRNNPDISPEESLLYAGNSPWSREFPGASGGLLVAEKLSLRILAPFIDAMVDKKGKS